MLKFSPRTQLFFLYTLIYKWRQLRNVLGCILGLDFNMQNQSFRLCTKRKHFTVRNYQGGPMPTLQFVLEMNSTLCATSIISKITKPTNQALAYKSEIETCFDIYSTLCTTTFCLSRNCASLFLCEEIKDNLSTKWEISLLQFKLKSLFPTFCHSIIIHVPPYRSYW